MPVVAEQTAFDPLVTARELLVRLNQARDADGQRLAELVTHQGYEPWWFHQSDLFWRILYPYCRHRSQFDRALAGRLDAAEAEPEVREVLRRLGFWPQARGRGGVPVLARLGRRISDAALLTLSLLALLVARLRQRDTVLMILDSVSPGLRIDFRLERIYRELEERGYRWLELAHARADFRSTWSNLARRRRLVAFPGLLAKYGVRLSGGQANRVRRAAGLDLEPTAEPEARFLALVARWHFRRCLVAGRTVEIYRKLLRLQKARRALLPDDERHLFPLTVACKLEGVPTAAFQHGLLNSYHAGLMAWGFEGAVSHGPDLMFAWSGYFRERLLRGALFDEVNCRVCGPIRPPDPGALEDARRARRRSPGPITVLLVSELAAPFPAVLEYFEELRTDRGLEVVVRLRPGEDPARWLASLRTGEERPRFDASATVLTAVAAADVVVGCYSSVLYEAIWAHRPVVVLDTGFSYGFDLVTDGLAVACTQPSEMGAAVRQALRTPSTTLAERAERIWGPGVVAGAPELFDVAERELWRAAPGGDR